MINRAGEERFGPVDMVGRMVELGERGKLQASLPRSGIVRTRLAEYVAHEKDEVRSLRTEFGC